MAWNFNFRKQRASILKTRRRGKNPFALVSFVAAAKNLLPTSDAGQTDCQLFPNNFGRVASEETAMGTIGAVFHPELIKLMKAVLDDAVATLPDAKRTSTMTAEIASQILACAAKGERDPEKLKITALSAVVECSHYSHDISPERRAV